jgi:hypothetical protein
MDSPKAVVQRQLEAYNARDIDAFTACFSEDVCIRELHDQTLIGDGLGALRELYIDLFQTCPELHAELLNRIERDAIVIDHERVTGLRPEVELAIAIYEVHDGLIQKVWFA